MRGATLKRALNLITIRPAPLEKQLEVARAAGFTGVGLWVNDVAAHVAAGGHLSDVVAMLRRHHLAVAELCLLGGWMYASPDEERRARVAARRAFQIAQAVGCDCVAACAAMHEGEIGDAAAGFARLCELAQPYGVKLALEFIGAAAQVKDLRTAWRVVEEAAAPNGGVLVDTFHLYRGESAVSDLAAVPADRIFLVHVSDCPDMPRAELEDRHRIFPGEGVIPLESISAALLDKDYRGYVSLELFNEEYRATDPALIAREGLRSLQRVGM